MRQSETAETARQFWQSAGLTEPFPRTLERAVTWALPVSIVRIKQLTVASMHLWLAARGFAETSGDARSLRGSLFAHRGVGIIFVDESDPAAEQRFSIGHETAHFILDYFKPRREAYRLLGATAGREVLDGIRAATPAERLAGVLRGVRIAPYTDLTLRGTSIDDTPGAIINSEIRADLLALELLAPWSGVVEAAKRLGGRGCQADHNSVQTLLETRFGLPSRIAVGYARRLAGSARAGQTFSEWLG